MMDKTAPVASFTVAPHRYLLTRNDDTDTFDWRATRDAAPYKVGEVVYVVYGDEYRRALIIRVDVRKTLDGDWQEYYEVRGENKGDGLFSRKSYRCYPGLIQRGYARALDLPKEYHK